MKDDSLQAHEHGAERVAILGGGEGATLREVLPTSLHDDGTKHVPLGS